MQNKQNEQNEQNEHSTQQELRLEFIPLPLAYKQIDNHAKVGRTILEALRVLHKALSEINPEHEALRSARVIMAEAMPILSDLLKGEDMIEEARKRTNTVLYGVEEIYPKEKEEEEEQDAEPAA